LKIHALSLAAVAVLTTLMAASPALNAADTPEPAPARLADPLAPARMHIAAKRWPEALAELKRVNATQSADWNNLQGYALRKQATPDLDGAQRHYDAALRIDPRHRGALEYAGELALMKGDLPTAEQRLAALARVCAGPCEEQDDLKKAVDKYKANGNRYLP
jgi:tetratricopeptide (TPR) repeat protein